MDIVGKLPRAPGQREYLIVVVDYFSKWVEAEALSKISEKGYEIRLEEYSMPIRHPKGICDGQRHAIPRSKISNEAKGNWEELPGVLWAYRTTSRRSTGESPFSLVYGTEAVVPVEIGEETLRVQRYELTSNSSKRHADLDLIQELRNNINARTTAYKAIMAKAYNSKVRRRGFQVGDLVLRRADATKNLEKLDAKWEGPYQVTEVIGSGTYKLQRMDGKEVPRTWNIANLKKYFV
ncbi:UNVERIFIED_CONTAM: hypothetical protein Slati_2676000 [Sesamum latifolium]|uniref:Uncharacterized protein n=1 Tax=Sesamum latifolium TaxID=2727402 RepID=A0AAW2VVR4_9LAMI